MGFDIISFFRIAYPLRAGRVKWILLYMRWVSNSVCACVHQNWQQIQMHTGGYGHVKGWVLGEETFRNQGCSFHQYRSSLYPRSHRISSKVSPETISLAGTQRTTCWITFASAGLGKGILQELWRHQAKLQDQKRQWNFISFTVFSF